MGQQLHAVGWTSDISTDSDSDDSDSDGLGSMGDLIDVDEMTDQSPELHVLEEEPETILDSD